jgi:hypothetical protein
METRLKIPTLLLTAGLILGMTGCAALTVDVDVYKGPLANHIDVKIEQTTAMTIAAKPLLVQLRNRLEKNHISNGKKELDHFEPEKCTGDTTNAKLAYRDILLQRPQYVNEFKGEYRFCDADARSVNNILFLYNDRKTGELSQILNRIKLLTAQYGKLYKIFRPNATEQLQLRSDWKKNQGGMYSNIKEAAQILRKARQDSTSSEDRRILMSSIKGISLDKAHILSKFIDSLPDKTEIEKRTYKTSLLFNLAALTNLFEDFQIRNPDFPLAHKKILHTHRILKQTLDEIKNETNSHFDFDSIKIFKKSINDFALANKRGDTSSNTTFMALNQKSLVEAYAQLLFPPDENKKDEFISRTREIANAYVASRKALEEILTDTLHLMIDGNTSNKDEVENRTIFNNVLGEFITTQINGLYLLGALKLSQDASYKSVAPVTIQLANKIKELNGKFFPEQSDSLKSLLVELFNNENEAATTALALLKTQDFYKSLNANPDTWKEVIGMHKSRAFIAARQFGLARGPGYPENEKINNEAEKNNFEKKDDVNGDSYYKYEPRQLASGINSYFGVLSKNIKSVLANGRLDLGLETLIENYLKASFNRLQPKPGLNCPANECETITVEDERNRLFKAMVRFGEKVRTDANYQILFSRNDPELDKYVRILQSVGNSIIFLVDDLEYLNTYSSNLAKNGPREWRALAINSSEYLNDVFKDMTSALNSQILALQADLSAIEALKGKKSSLEKKVTQHSATHTFFKNNKTNIDDAIKGAAISDSKDLVEKKVELKLTDKNKPLDDTKRQLISSSMNLIKNILTENLLKTSQASGKFKATEIFNELDTQIEHLILTLTNEKEKIKITLASKEKSVGDEETAKTKKAALIIARSTLEKQKGTLTQDIAKNNQQFMPIAFKANIKSKAKETLDKDTQESSDNKKKNDIAFKAISTLLAQIKIPIPPAPVKTPDAKEVMDGLISTLKFEHIHLVKQFGRQSPITLQAEAALKVAYDRRANMVRIRPAISYLRTSFPSTTLQRDANTTSKNMLIRDTVKNIPIIGELFHEDIAGMERAKITREIDKQFWQNINRIKLSGGGQTNYVLMKDDVGNWVIKSYSSDPTDIIKSAKNLALFSMGPGFTNGLIDQGGVADVASNAITDQTGSTPAADQATPETKKPMTLMEKQFDTFQKEYDNQTKKDLTEIGNDVNSIQKDIEGRWEQDFASTDDDKAKKNADTLSKLKSAFTKSSVKAYLDAAKKDNSSSMKPQEEIIEKLKQTMYMHKTLRSEIHKEIVDTARENFLKDNTKQDEYIAAQVDYKKAVQGLNAAVRLFENKYIGRRKSASEKFDSAVRVTTTTINN